MRLMPLIEAIGCSLAEIVGLELDDIVMDEEVIHVRPNSNQLYQMLSAE